MKHPKNRKFLKLRLPSCLKLGALLLALCASGGARADAYGPPNWLISSSANCAYLQTPFNLPFSFELTMGTTANWIYVGMGADYWLASEGIGAARNQLNYIGGIAEAGFISRTPRLFWLVTGGVIYPFVLNVQTAAGTQLTSATTPLSYRVKGVAGMRLTPILALTLGVGYRMQDLGDLSSYNGGSLNMTGLFFTAGLSFTLY